MLRRPERVRGVLLTLFVLLAAMAPSATGAHDVKGVLHDLTSSKVPESLKTFNRAYITERDQRMRAALVVAFQWPWPPPVRLSVCFDKGPVDLRPKIAAAMREWATLTEGNLSFVFGSRVEAQTGEPLEFQECDGVTHHQIRIGFVRDDGHWSQIGTLSGAVFPENSMNLDFDTDPRPDDQTVREVTMHETGHAVGFHHEHQSPGAPCKNWAWNRILASYDWPGSTVKEKEKAMHDNLDRLNDYILPTGQHAYKFTAYDKVSIMHYSFPASMFVDGQNNPCAIEQPRDLSAADKAAMKDAYATQPSKSEKTRGIDLLLSMPRYRGFHDLLKQEKERDAGR